MPWFKNADGNVVFEQRFTLEWTTSQRDVACRACPFNVRLVKRGTNVLRIQMPSIKSEQAHLCEKHGLEFLDMAVSLRSQSKGASDERRREETETRQQDGAEA